MSCQQGPQQSQKEEIQVDDPIFNQVESNIREWSVTCLDQIDSQNLNQFNFKPENFLDLNHALKKWVYAMLSIMQKAPHSFERFVYCITDTLEADDISENGPYIDYVVKGSNSIPYSNDAKHRLFQVVRQELKFIYHYAGAGYFLDSLKKYHPKRLQRIIMAPQARIYIEEYDQVSNPYAAPVELFCYVFNSISSFDTNFC
ncbi:hypothetical protein C6P40_002157 [Pichia californica]|uniref:Uncharacterized protein n=1 Tax=Pichia californica TaxID=460514 RepID=A0A9P6WI50_9ASCO|nr:hypothetical protein C6P42_002180 [[Candida] californica]KAG0687585.1 hypothetical protein C6P40_002157 [[Candida] californica]